MHEDQILKLKEAQTAFINTVNNFPTGKRMQILFGRWGLKDILGHVSAWNLYSIQCLQDLREGKEPLWELAVNKLNARETKKRKDWSFEKVYRELVESAEKLVEAYQNLPAELWDRKLWPKRRWTPRKFLETDFKHYQKDHLPQIRKHLL